MSIDIDLRALSPSRRDSMLAAGHEVRACRRALLAAGLNVVGEVLRGQGDFVELEHYPRDDVFDADTHSQYYYHAHRGSEHEHGHFHLFMRAPGMPDGCIPGAATAGSEEWLTGDEAISHLVAISMDAWGDPVGLFCTNRWVTAETWYPAEHVVAMLDRFAITHAAPNWAVSRWITAMLHLFRPHIEALVRQRDEVVAQWRQTHPGTDVFEDRALELTGYLPVSVDALIEQLEQSLLPGK